MVFLFVYFTLDTVYKFLGSFKPNPNQDIKSLNWPYQFVHKQWVLLNWIAFRKKIDIKLIASIRCMTLNRWWLELSIPALYLGINFIYCCALRQFFTLQKSFSIVGRREQKIGIVHGTVYEIHRWARRRF